MPTKKVVEHRATPFTLTVPTPTKAAPESNEVPIEILMEVKQNKEEEKALPTKKPTVKPIMSSLPDTIAHLRAAIQNDEDEDDTQNEITMLRVNAEEEKKKREEERRAEEERKRREEERKRKEEEEKKRKEEEERKRMEEEKRKADEERRRREEESKKQQQERDRQQRSESKPPLANVIAHLRANSLPDEDEDTPSMSSLLKNSLQQVQQTKQSQQSQRSQQSQQSQQSQKTKQPQDDSKKPQSLWPETKKSHRKGKKRSRRSTAMRSPVARIRSFAEIRYEAGNSSNRLRRSAA